ncbi:methyl-accepting chemotaxis protein [Geomesophilobacter sediminis]|uniref:Methyl-accepting chemotaxis protein n=1 Tax=Geomesophilobacter sediminis TaxID=2798584 RepID=A0A8J7JL19_9BACT|nr:methyl-accepting chemotaxis protein [Geomesophilobacter sediminis]MBJ6724415.1 methyl-accepting chemotaxis protein [Geomesophilobacter sediminis]
MYFLQDLYLRLSIKARIALLCACYTVCMVLSSIFGQSNSMLIRWGSLAVFTGAGLFFGMLNIWGIGSSIDRVIKYLQTMAQGNLTENISAKRNNEISLIIKTIAELQQSMRTMIQSIQSTSSGLNQASSALRQTSDAMAAGVRAAVGQTGSAVQAVGELSSVSADIAHNCQVMAQKASETKGSTVEGERTISAMSQMMAEIDKMVTDTTSAVQSLGHNSEQIGEIVDTIEDIADQTNLLALNAAIEAARAGEQGRGFAVVADEVRSLAERTTKATREIQRIIGVLQGDVKNVIDSMGQSSESVKNGERGVQLSSQAISEIRTQIEVLTDAVSQVATAVEEQAATTAGVSHNIRSINEVIENVSSGAQNTGNAASDLASSADELKNLAGRFSV